MGVVEEKRNRVTRKLREIHHVTVLELEKLEAKLEYCYSYVQNGHDNDHEILMTDPDSLCNQLSKLDSAIHRWEKLGFDGCCTKCRAEIPDDDLVEKPEIAMCNACAASADSNNNVVYDQEVTAGPVTQQGNNFHPDTSVIHTMA